MDEVMLIHKMTAMKKNKKLYYLDIDSLIGNAFNLWTSETMLQKNVA